MCYFSVCPSARRRPPAEQHSPLDPGGGGAPQREGEAEGGGGGGAVGTAQQAMGVHQEAVRRGGILGAKDKNINNLWEIRNDCVFPHLRSPAQEEHPLRFRLLLLLLPLPPAANVRSGGAERGRAGRYRDKGSN